MTLTATTQFEASTYYMLECAGGHDPDGYEGPIALHYPHIPDGFADGLDAEWGVAADGTVVCVDCPAEPVRGIDRSDTDLLTAHPAWSLQCADCHVPHVTVFEYGEEWAPQLYDDRDVTKRVFGGGSEFWSQLDGVIRCPACTAPHIGQPVPEAAVRFNTAINDLARYGYGGTTRSVAEIEKRPADKAAVEAYRAAVDLEDAIVADSVTYAAWRKCALT